MKILAKYLVVLEKRVPFFDRLSTRHRLNLLLSASCSAGRRPGDGVVERAPRQTTDPELLEVGLQRKSVNISNMPELEIMNMYFGLVE